MSRLDQRFALNPGIYLYRPPSGEEADTTWNIYVFIISRHFWSYDFFLMFCQIARCAPKVTGEASATPATLAAAPWPGCSWWPAPASWCWPLCYYYLQLYSLSAGVMGSRPPASLWYVNYPPCARRRECGRSCERENLSRTEILRKPHRDVLNG